MNESTPLGGELPLTEQDFEAYRRIAEGLQPPADYAIQRLVSLRLVDPDPYAPSGWVPHDPRGAAHGLTTAVLQDLTRVAQLVAHIPTLEGLSRHFDPQRLYGGPGSEFLPTAAQMNARLGEIGTAAAAEFCSIQPGEPADRDPAILRLGVERTRSALQRGVNVRSIYHRSAHEHDQTSDYVEAMIKDGADVRASTMPGPRMVIIDARHLFIDNVVIDDAEGNSGWHVFDRAAVAWVRSLFDLFWDAAERWQDLCTTRCGSPLSERQLRILRMLAEGYGQQQIGSRIGLSERAIAKELLAVRRALDAQTTYQVMAWYGRQQVGLESPST
ncbi:regulatory LuxR family protein [Streptomyces sp. 3212.3]|uniref:helix-turn-helix transcriptional regulator n=1 Tax=Streptomyces sp. 3212.3 TaxID=1938846 RepID=UPI000E226C66|nr:LuxR C-terminal-related transcriptional regulator [Streptomyces sp. 3212.3]REE62107.1 regulatory LuxR family protein [Streptomyces sp. 3212.3]